MNHDRNDHLGDGFTILEVIVALALLATMAAGIAPLFQVAAGAARGARAQTSATALAAQKMEQLRALTWGYDAAGLIRLSDSSTDLSSDPPTALGTGLGPSPIDSLNHDTSGYTDYLDGAGRWVGAGTTPPSRATFIRRWNIQPSPTNADTLVLQVLVSTVVGERQRISGAALRARQPEDAFLVSLKSRSAR